MKAWKKIPFDDFQLEGLVITPLGITLKKEEVFKTSWALKIPGPLDGISLLPCGRLLLNKKGRLFTLLLPEGEEIPFPTPANIKEALVLASSLRDIYLLSSSWIRAYSQLNLQLRWETKAPPVPPLQAFSWRNKLYIFCKTKEVFIYSSLDGRFIGQAGPFDFESMAAGRLIWGLRGEKLVSGQKEYPLEGPLPGKKKELLAWKDDLYLILREGNSAWLLRLEPYERYQGIRGEICSKCPCSCEKKSPFGLARIILSQKEAKDQIFYFQAEIPSDTEVRLICQEEKEGKILWETCQQELVFPIPSSLSGSLKISLCLKGRRDGQRAPMLKLAALIPSVEEWLKYLPSVYREDKETCKFLKNLLGPFKVIYSQFLAQIESWPEKLSLVVEDPEVLRYLAGWFDINPEEKPTKIKARLNSWPSLYPFRGTRAALETVLSEIPSVDKTQRPVVLIEAFEWLEIPDETGQSTRAEGWIEIFGTDLKSFVVLVDYRIDETDWAHLKELILDWTPLGTEAKIVRLRPRLLLGEPLVLGWNTILGSEPLILGQSYLGQSLLYDQEPGGRLEERAWLGLDTYLS